MYYRGVDTLVGGLLALTAYAVWPTWERTRTWPVLAYLLESYRAYFDKVMAGFLQPVTVDRAELDSLRSAARLARSNAQASVDRMRAEPGTAATDLDLAQSLLASSHRFAQTTMALEALLYSPEAVARPPREKIFLASLECFVQDVDRALEALSSVLRRSAASLLCPLPENGRPFDLRRDQTHLAAAAGREVSPLLLETERITNSVNTMLALVQPPRSSPAPRGRSLGTLPRM